MKNKVNKPAEQQHETKLTNEDGTPYTPSSTHQPLPATVQQARAERTSARPERPSKR